MRKNVIDNPRYPHHIRIIRKVVKDWLEDASLSGSSSSSDEGEHELVVYDGCGRSYTDTTTTGDAKVDSNKRKASIPVRFDKWGRGCHASHTELPEPPVPMSGDLLFVTKGHITEEWELKDFEPDNDRSVVYGELSRNFNIE